MSLADELLKLEQLRERGSLTAEEFERAKARLLGTGVEPVGSTKLAQSLNSLRRSGTDKWIAGVCGGIAAATGVDAWIWRLLLAVLFFAGGMGLVLYILLWIFVPAE
ncbi:MAG: PspC domain-containing protein [Hydrogenophaga sp.]|jgi:phage shock protein PspC (stress-responsive transcriptional regulator)|uniref:PspC domain-containing protein n=1 Tax=Hydrogenophaga sp. TaxID=1904254 RepID=UPI002728CF06|nr:PspC domain-containing protein [Hydrogenophaga sp.]MDP1967979.1 PspC domain-containing protein [Burkholderiaceae bacterium]MDO9203382.1 PspC domain-containing protein [Hydrogenophaga sp.]MDO9483102.1 PspC domain-containing protein [Hydrogenophaga sp.]MDP2096886.1 PspC domain-containing protein [Hydrogenophaga sp.]MDP2218589.1 PspC domain-containing protein [Hydrogenophaga sp.]